MKPNMEEKYWTVIIPKRLYEIKDYEYDLKYNSV